MKRYESYKPSGISWIGEIPSHWETRKIRSLYALRSEKVSDKDFEPLSVSKQGITPQLEDAVKTDNGDNRKLVRIGDFVVNSRSDRKGSCGVSEYEGSVSLINIVTYPITSINSAYFHLLFRSNDYIEEFYRLGKGIVADLWTTKYDEMRNISVPFPPLDEQKKIVEFLSSKTAKIDALQAEREQELRLLEELKQAEIANVVTRGLNPNVPMKDSGIPWIGQIPTHWTKSYLFQICNEHFISNKNVHHQNLLSLSYGKIVQKDINKTDGLLPESFDTYQIVEPGNIILRLTDLQNDQKSLRVGLAKEEGIITSAYVAIELKNNTLPEYLYFILHMYDIKKVFYSMGGGLRQSLNYDGMRKLIIPIPPLEEQRAIVEYIEQKNKAIDDMIANLRAEIDFLTEYKQRLIADAVTGQIKID